MNLYRKSFQVGLSAILVLSTTLPAFCESMWVPRLGYPTTGAKRIYLDVSTSEQRDADEKAVKTKDKEARKELKETRKAEKEQAKENKHKDDADTADVKEDSPAEPAPSVTSAGEDNKDSKEKPDKHLAREEARKHAEAMQIAKRKAQIAALQEKQAKEPVDGTFYLYNLKQGRLLFQEASKLESADKAVAKAPYYVEFTENPVEGLYDLAVRGSGHRSQEPLWVSDSIYWDALLPVVQDMGKSHCPVEDGKYRVIQECYFLNATKQSAAITALEDQRTQLVKGGWYTDDSQTSQTVKSTAENANLAQTLMHLYQLNPKSYKFLEIPGESYEQSRYPDILDEVSWGINYLLTIQQPDGGFPAGIQKAAAGSQDKYALMAETQDSTARAVMALATAVHAFKQEDLSQAVKFMRSAEKGWEYLKAQSHVDPQLLLMASAALKQVSDSPEYSQAFEEAKARVHSISPETALLLGPMSEGISVDETAVNTSDQQVSAMLPLMVQLEQNNKAALAPLSDWVTNLFGYEEISLVRDPNLAVVSGWTDPLQWMATKTGEVATRWGQKLQDSGISRMDVNTDSKHLKDLEDKEKAARQRVQDGYNSLKLSSSDRVYLAYALALLNQHVAFDADPDKKQPEPPRNNHEEPGGSLKSFYPKAI